MSTDAITADAITADLSLHPFLETSPLEFQASKLCSTHPEPPGRRRSSLSRSSSRLARWLKFNFVGAVGIGVQFAALLLLKGVMHLDYLVATAVAVEIAVLHNFVWHERFTWADRINVSSSQSSLLRLLRFQLANGAVSIAGNLALMKVMVGMGHMNYLAANAVAIALCSVANFLVSDEWVFGDRLLSA
jgi:putative flippase GtrA